MFRERLEHSIQGTAQRHVTIAILFLDLDRFKIVNDTLGHPIGGLLLKQMANRLS